MVAWKYVKTSGNYNAEREDGQLGYAKWEGVAKEQLASCLAKLIGVNVPNVDIFVDPEIDSRDPMVISHVRNSLSKPLENKEGKRAEFDTYRVEEASKAASGLIPFLHWIGATDHNDDTNLVVEVLDDNKLQIVAIDFEHAFAWDSMNDLPTKGGALPLPPTLVDNIDPDIIEITLKKIEAVNTAEIEKCVKSISEEIGSTSMERCLDRICRERYLIREKLRVMGI